MRTYLGERGLIKPLPPAICAVSNFCFKKESLMFLINKIFNECNCIDVVNLLEY